MRIRCLGTGSGNPHPDRMTSSTLIEGPRGALLFDAGEGCSRRMLEPGIWRQEIRSVLITHRHADHHAGLPMLLSGLKTFGRAEPLEIAAAKPLLTVLRGWIDTLKLGSDQQPFALNWRVIEPGPVEFASEHRGEIWRNDHLPVSDLGGSHSLALDLGGQRWVFSADIGSVGSLAGHLDGAVGLIVEGWHVDPEEAVKFARDRGVERVYLTHAAPSQHTPPIAGAQWVRDNDIIDTGEIAS